MAIKSRRSLGISNRLGMNYTLDDLENNEQFQEISERFLTSIGEQSDDIFEYFRDSDFNLAKGLKRMVDTGNFNEQQKQDYAYLRSTFDGADMGSMKQYLGLVKDAGIDMLSDPTLLASVLFTPVSGGTTLATRIASGKAAQQALKGLVKVNTKPSKITAGQSAALVAGEAGAWSGTENYFRQNAEVNTKMRKAFSAPELAGTTATGLLVGGVFGGLANKNQFFKDRMERLYTNDMYRKEAGSDLAFNARRLKDRILANSIASPAWILKGFAEFSPNARLLGQKMTSEFNKDLTRRSKQRLGYSYAEDIQFRRGNYKEAYEDAIRPLYSTGRMSVEQGEQVVTLLRGGKVPNASKEVVQVSKNLRKFYDGIRDDAIKAGMNVQEIIDYFPRSWNRQAIQDNPEKFKKMLTRLRTDKDGNKFRIVDRDKVDDVVEGMLNKQDELYSSHSNLLTQARKFENLDDNLFKEFLTNDLHMVTTDYFMNAARTIEHKIHFLQKGSDVRVMGKTDSDNLIMFKMDNEAQFVKRFIDPINKDLKKFGRQLTARDKKQIINTYKSITGQVDYFRGQEFQALYDGTKLANAMAYLPLATVSSLSEAFIALGKAPTSSAVKGMQDAIENAGHIFQRDMGQILKEKHKLTDNEIVQEMNRVFLAVDEAVADLTNRLDGEGLQNEFLKRGARGFYRLNMLIPWTKTVQLAAFSTGKDMIMENLRRISTNTNAFGKTLSKNSKERLEGELLDLGVNIDEGLKFIEKYGDNINETARQTNFYRNDITRGAGRFTNGVILQTGREFANVPTFMTNPKKDIFTQFLRYPTVFGNTVLRNFARNTITDTAVNAPKLAAFIAISTNVAKATNYWRASEEERARIDRGEDKVYDNIKAVQRVGLLGPPEYLFRLGEGMAYGQSPITAAIGTGGPVIGDAIGMLMYDRGLVETLARKAPLTGTKNIFDRYLGDIMEEYTGVREPYTPLQEAAKPIKIPRGKVRKAAGKFFPKETKSKTERGIKKRKPLNIGGKVSSFVARKLNTSKLGDNLKPIFYKKVDDMEGGPSDYNIDGEITPEFDEELQKLIQSYYMDRFGNVSPVLRSLANDAPVGMTGPKLIKFLKKEATRGKGTAVTKEEMDYLDIEQYIMDYPYKEGIEIVEDISDRRLEIVPFIRTETGLKSDLKFDTTNMNKDEFFKFEGITEPTDTSPANALTKKQLDELFGKKDIEVIKVDLSDVDRALGDDYFIDTMDRNLNLYAYGNEDIGYKISSQDKRIQDLLKDSDAINMSMGDIASPAEAKIQMQSFMQEQQLLADFEADYSVVLKDAIDGNSPGGKNYKEVIYNVQGRKVSELNNASYSGFHFGGADEVTQFGHTAVKDRKLRKGDIGIINSRHIEELQSDYYTKFYDYGMKSNKNRKLAIKIYDETSKIQETIRDKINYINEKLDYANPKTIEGYNNLDPIDFSELIKLSKDREGNTRNIISGIQVQKLINTLDTDVFKSLPEDLQKLDFNFEIPRSDLTQEGAGQLLRIDELKELYRRRGLTELERKELETIKEKIKEVSPFIDLPPIELQARLLKDLRDKGEDYVTGLLPVRETGLYSNEVVEVLKEEFNKLLVKDLVNLLDEVSSVKMKYGFRENLVPKNPITKKFYKRILERELYAAAQEGKDSLSVANGDIIQDRYGRKQAKYTRPLYDKNIPNYMKELAEEYGGTFENLQIDKNDLIDEAGVNVVDFYEQNRELIEGVREALFEGEKTIVDRSNLYNVNTIIITPELREKILKFGVRTFATGGLVTGTFDVPNTKENPADRVDPNTGIPYSEQMTRLGFQEGGDVTTRTSNSNRDYIYNRFTNEFGYRPEAVIGMLGNFSVESGDTFRHDIIQGELEGNPLVYTEEDIKKGVTNKATKKLKTSKDIGKPKRGYGIAQFDFMRDYYFDYLSHNNKQDSLDSHIEYINDVIQGTDTYANFDGKMLGNKEREKLNEALLTGNIEETTKVFMEVFEKPGIPHLDRRINASKKIAEELGRLIIN